MAINERSRHDLFARLEEVLGKEHATVLMEHLPPVGWADVATKHDLDQLERRLEMRFDTVEARFDSKLDTQLATFRSELNAQTRIMISQTRTMIFGMATAFVAVAGATLAAARFV